MISGIYPMCFLSEDNFFEWQEHDKVTVLDKQKDLDVQVSYFMFHCKYCERACFLTCVLESRS